MKTPTVYVRLDSGLTDQIRLFMIAYCAHKRHPDYNIVFDLSFFVNREKEIAKQQKNPNYKKNNNFGHCLFNLDKFKISEVVPYKTTELSFFKRLKLSARNFLKRNVVSRIKYELECDVIVKQKNLAVQIENLPMCFEEISNMFELSVPMNESNLKFEKLINESKNSVCLHIRRGDALGGYKTADYIYEKIDNLLKISKTNELDLFVFSNDLKWCVENLNNKERNNLNFIFVDANKEDEPHFELNLMKKCKYFILTTGQFGKLAYTLSKHRDKEIVSDIIFP